MNFQDFFSIGERQAKRPVERSPERQREIENDLQGLVLYQTAFCPYCIRVRQTMAELQLPIPVRDIQREPAYRAELIAGGGRAMVPCLRIERAAEPAYWMYESADIIRYLRERFAE